MPTFMIDPRTGLIRVQPPAPRTTAFEMLQKVKRVHRPLMARHNIIDEWVIQLIDNVIRGTRNIHYLNTKSIAEKEIAYFVLREQHRGGNG